MSKRILLSGRAGSGKTSWVLSRISEYIRDRREEDCLLLLPTQSQVDHAKTLLLGTGRRAFRDLFIHTFFSFTRGLADDLPGQLLSEEARDYLLAELLREEKLPSFERVKDTPGFRRRLGRSIKELKENGIGPEDFNEKILSALGETKRCRARHRDLGKALAAYQARLARSGRVDAEDLAGRALWRLQNDPSRLRRWEFLAVDGFHDFTLIQLRLLKFLSSKIPDSLFTLSFDPSSPRHPVFAVSVSTREELLGWNLEEEALRGNHRTHDPALIHLEQNLYAERTPKEEAGEALRIVRASRREEEVEEIARSILRLVREGRIPYREIAVLYRNLDEMVDLIEGTFGKYGIPVRLFHRRRLEKEPLARFLLDLGRLLAGNWEEARVFRFLRLGYLVAVDPEEVDRLDEAVREEGAPDGPARWQALCRRLGLEKLERVLNLLARTATLLRKEPVAGRLSAPWWSVIQQLALPLGEEGPRGRVESAALESFTRVMEEAERRLGEGSGHASWAKWVAEVEEGVSQAEFRVRDRRREVVNVIDAFEARQWEVPHLFVAGVLERQFPPFPTEDLFFNDEERKDLARAGLRFADRKWRQQEERFLFYTALTRARVSLTLSHPVSDSSGNPTLPSFFLREVEHLFSESSLKERTFDRRPAAILPPLEEIGLEEEVDRTLFLGMEERYPRGRRSSRAALAAALYQQRIGDQAFRARLAVALERPRPVLADPRILEEIRTGDCRFSSTRLEGFLQCPYLHFAEQWLRLEPLPERDLSPRDLGEILHEVIRECLEGGEGADPQKLLERRFVQVAKTKQQSFARKAEQWRLARTLSTLLRDEQRIRAARRLVPERFELSFGSRESPSPVTINVDGKEERFSGRIDRVDVTSDGKAGLVVDYKYSRPRRVESQWKESGAGESLERFQLALYLLALQESLGLEPLGAELVALKGNIVRMGILSGLRREETGLPAVSESHWRVFEPPEYETFLGRVRIRLAEVVRSIRSGRIGTEPRDESRCGPEDCPAADLCRFEWWLGAQGEPTSE